MDLQDVGAAAVGGLRELAAHLKELLLLRVHLHHDLLVAGASVGYVQEKKVF
jgi:hypothetical protein